MAGWSEPQRAERVKLARRRDIAMFRRVRRVCVHASTSIDLDHHAASVVLVIHKTKERTA